MQQVCNFSVEEQLKSLLSLSHPEAALYSFFICSFNSNLDKGHIQCRWTKRRPHSHKPVLFPLCLDLEHNFAVTIRWLTPPSGNQHPLALSEWKQYVYVYFQHILIVTGRLINVFGGNCLYFVCFHVFWVVLNSHATVESSSCRFLTVKVEISNPNDKIRYFNKVCSMPQWEYLVYTTQSVYEFLT